MQLQNANLPVDLHARLSQVRLLALDSDGVLTDGGVYVMDDGREFRRFDIKDGLGLKRVMEAGIHVAILSGSRCTSIVHRAQTLGISQVYVGVENKLSLLSQICEQLQITLQQVAYIGDDLPDLPVLECVGLPCAPSDADSAVLASAVIVTSRPAGYGAVREVCDYLETVLSESG